MGDRKALRKGYHTLGGTSTVLSRAPRSQAVSHDAAAIRKVPRIRRGPVRSVVGLPGVHETSSSQTVQDAPPPSCHVTLASAGSALSSSPIRATQVGIASNGLVSAYGTRKLSTLLPTDGIWRGAMPSKPGDFVYDNKLPWHGAFSYSDGNGPVRVTGKRLDGLARLRGRTRSYVASMLMVTWRQSCSAIA